MLAAVASAGTRNGTARIFASCAVASTQESLLERDRIDSGRATAPLTMAEGAVHVDSTHLSLVEVIDRIVDLATQAQGEPGAQEGA